MKNIKVCMMTSVHSHNDVRIFEKESKILRDSGCQVYIICNDFKGIKDGITFIQSKIHKKRWIRILVSWYEFYKRGLDLDCNIYHIHDPELLPAGFLLKRKGKKIVYDSHEDTPKQMINKPYSTKINREILGKIIKAIENRADKKFDLIITATDSIGKKFKKNVTVCNYPKLEYFPKEKLKDYRKKEKQVCYVGLITKNRGKDEMIEVAHRGGINHVFAGKFENKLEEIESLRDRNNVIYKGDLGQKEALKIIDDSRIGICILKPISNYQDALPTKVFEYMASGIPAIISDFGYWKEIFGNSACIYVNPYDIENIIENEKYLLNNPDIAENRGLAGRELIEKRYNFEKEGKKLVEAYKKIAKEISLK